MSAHKAVGAAVSTLAKLIEGEISPEPSRPRKAARIPIDAAITAIGTENAPAAFERAALNYLAEHRVELGINALWRCKNTRIDALVELKDRRRLAIEVKFRMNWEKACQACAQIGWFHTRAEPEGIPINGGLVIFEEFTGDWARPKASWVLEPGWSYFYADHHRVEGVRVDLVRLRSGKLETFPEALAAERPGGEAGP